jgi:hypothetical protein
VTVRLLDGHTIQALDDWAAVGVALVGEKLGADRRCVVRCDVGDASVCADVVDHDDLIDSRELTVEARPFGCSRLSIEVDELNVVRVPPHWKEGTA